MQRPIRLLVVATALAGCADLLGIEERASYETEGGATSSAPASQSTTSGGDAAATGSGAGTTCNHDCLEGDCEGGRCQPYALSFPLTVAEYNSLRVDGGPEGEIYFARWRVATAPAGVDLQIEPEVLVQLPEEGSDTISSIAVDENSLYFLGYGEGQVFRVAL